MPPRQANTGSYVRRPFKGIPLSRGRRPSPTPLLDSAERTLLFVFGLCVALSLIALECWGSGHLSLGLRDPGNGHPLHAPQRPERTEIDLTILDPIHR